ncbi:hypothetical protein EW146_g6542 [Bondarzewia mesenterica]|uniref:Uncharacterized protein n=1 Tax=Bondarzewia mesenterica TaxID=1095465 RepID=A0A4S4LP60_9AGAM|nr:hypothetical protein EW146_g6542 [Bondarzewia mesenterica]
MPFSTVHPHCSNHFVISSSSAASSPTASHQVTDLVLSRSCCSHHKCGHLPFIPALESSWIPHKDLQFIDDTRPLLIDDSQLPRFIDHSHAYPSPPLTDSELRRTVPLPQVSVAPSDSSLFYPSMPDDPSIQFPPSPPSTYPLTPRSLPDTCGEPSVSLLSHNYVGDDLPMLETDAHVRLLDIVPYDRIDDADYVDWLTPLSPTWDLRFEQGAVPSGSVDESALMAEPPSCMPLTVMPIGDPMKGTEDGVNHNALQENQDTTLLPLQLDALWNDHSYGTADRSHEVDGSQLNVDDLDMNDAFNDQGFCLGDSELNLRLPPGDDSPHFMDLDLPLASPRHAMSNLPELDLFPQEQSSTGDDEVAPSSPSRRSFTSLPDMDEDEDEFSDTPQPSSPLSPSRRSFASLPDMDMDEVISPSRPTPSARLLSLPGAETDDDLIVPDSSHHADSEPPPPSDGPSLGLFVPIASADAAATAGSPPEEEPDLHFSDMARSRVDTTEFDKLISLRRRAWFLERNAKRTEQSFVEEAQRIAAGLRVSPPVPGALADVQLQAGLDPKGAIRRELQVAEARRAEARRVRKKEKERGKEVQALLRLKLGEDSTGVSVAPAADGSTVQRDGRGKVVICSFSQLVARMIFKRRDSSRLLANRNNSGENNKSPLSQTVLPDADCMDLE